MDVSIFVESWREGVKSGMRKEPTIKKVIIASGGLVTLFISLIIGSYQMSYWGNTVNMQNNYDITQIYNNTDNPYMNSTYYDIAFIDGPFVNLTEANELKLKIAKISFFLISERYAIVLLLLIGLAGQLELLDSWIGQFWSDFHDLCSIGKLLKKQHENVPFSELCGTLLTTKIGLDVQYLSPTFSSLCNQYYHMCVLNVYKMIYPLILPVTFICSSATPY